jgi:hypothetical protein
MAVTQTGRAFTLTALNDEVSGFMKLNSLRLSGTGLTVGNRVTVRDGFGHIVVDHYIADVNASEESLVEGWTGRGLKITAAPTGTWSIIGRKS